MTKEEAIKYLQQLYPHGGCSWLDEQRIEAIGMAVNALQEEPKSKCQGCNNVKGCITCVDGSEWAHIEEVKVPKVFEDMLNAKTPTESLGISQEKWNKIEEECVFGKEEPVSGNIDFEQELYKSFGQVKDFTLGMQIAKRFYDMGKNSQEPISENFEEALAQEWKGYNDRGAATVDALEDNTQELAFSKGFYWGAKWGKNQAKVEIQAQSMALAHGCPKEPVSKDLEAEIEYLSKRYPEVSFAKLSRIAVHVSEWQKKQMMAEAIDVEVKVDAGCYPYIPQIELYDYDKDVPLAKEGDKYKVVFIKEE